MSERQADIQHSGSTNRITPSFQRDPLIDLPGNDWCFPYGEIDILSDEPEDSHLNGDEESLCVLSAARNRALEQMTVVEPSDGEREEQFITPNLEHREMGTTPPDSDVEDGEITSESDPEVHTTTLEATNNNEPTLTTTELGPGYGDQVTSSQSLAPYPRKKEEEVL